MTTNDPEDSFYLGRLRLLAVNGEERLAMDFAKERGTSAPVAVTGPNAVVCPRCRANAGDQCGGGFPHLERLAAMNNEMARLRAVRDQREAAARDGGA